MKKLILAGIVTLGGIFTAQAQCKTVTTLSENFDAWKDISKCWTAHKGKAMLYASEKKVIFYSMQDPRENMYLVTPKVKAGSYTLSMDISDNGGETTLEVLSASNPSDPKSFAPLIKASKITGDKKTLTVSLKKDSHIALKVLLNGVHQAVYVDNLSLKPKK